MKLSPLTSFGTTAVLAILVLNCSKTTAETTMAPSPEPTPAQIADGKALVDAKCVGCHGSSLGGVPQFAPSIKSTGVLKEYNIATFERVLNTGITNDGTPVSPPMPVFHMKPAKSFDIYSYLTTRK